MPYALVFGLLLPVLMRINEALSRHLGQLPGSFLIHLVGAVFGAVAFLPFCSRTWVGELGRVPWWAFLGGVIGSGMVMLANLAIQRLGVGGFIAVNVATQLATGAVMDHFGLLGGQIQPFNVTKLAGMALLAAGASLAVRG
jgi:transporter family-2 protein